MRVAGQPQLRNRRRQVDHRGHRDPGVVVAVLAQRPAGGVGDRPQRQVAGESAEVVEVAQEDVDRLESSASGMCANRVTHMFVLIFRPGLPSDLGHRRLAPDRILVVFERSGRASSCRSGRPSPTRHRPFGSIRSRALGPSRAAIAFIVSSSSLGCEHSPLQLEHPEAPRSRNFAAMAAIASGVRTSPQ